MEAGNGGRRYDIKTVDGTGGYDTGTMMIKHIVNERRQHQIFELGEQDKIPG